MELNKERVSKLLKERDELNTKIEMVNKSNEARKKELEIKIKELQAIGVDINIDNIEEVKAKYETKLEKEYVELEKAISETKEKLEGLI